MAMIRVRLNPEGEETLRRITESTGLTISEVIRQSLRDFDRKVQAQRKKSAYEIYKEIQLGSGGWAIDDSLHVSRGMTKVLKRKLKN